MYVISLEQEKITELPFMTALEARDEIHYPVDGRFHSIWPFMCSLKGIWYTLGITDEDGWFNSMSIVEVNYDKIIKESDLPYWILDEDEKSNFVPIIIVDEYRKDFERILEFLIQQSPNKTILFLVRSQCGDKDVIAGVLEYEAFIMLLNQSKILLNICYIIKK
jgi:hypothetical protein